MVRNSIYRWSIACIGGLGSKVYPDRFRTELDCILYGFRMSCGFSNLLYWCCRLPDCSSSLIRFKSSSITTNTSWCTSYDLQLLKFTHFMIGNVYTIYCLYRMTRSSSWHTCFVFGSFRLKISPPPPPRSHMMAGFRGYSQSALQMLRQ
jgi:hypothetical protein